MSGAGEGGGVRTVWGEWVSFEFSTPVGFNLELDAHSGLRKRAPGDKAEGQICLDFGSMERETSDSTLSI